MATELSAKFENPPVTETAIGVQFAPIGGFTSAHFGWYWKNFLGHTWTRTEDATLLPDQFEKFGDQAKENWHIPPFLLTRIQLNAKMSGPDRLKIINDNNDRMIQVQTTRFHYNWRHGAASYPGFNRVCPEFLSEFARFRGFVKEAGLGEILPNQWEITYVNHIPKGPLWESPADWSTIFPGLFPIQHASADPIFESLSGEWHYEIPPRKGRLHVSVQHGKAVEDETELLILTLTARGPVAPSVPGDDVLAGLNLGHGAAVRTFVALASDAALNYWKAS